MNVTDLEFGLKAVSSCGSVLSCEELVGIKAGTTLLRSQQKYSALFLWGKISGQQSDYYLCYGLRDPEFEFPSKDFFYSGEDFKFRALKQLTEEAADKIVELGLTSSFSGDPTAPLAPKGEAHEEGGDPLDEAAASLTEEDRLAQVVQELDFDTAAVPKGAHALNEAHVVVPSSDFRGLGYQEAAQLSSYVHFRPPTSVASLRAFARDDAHFYRNFLDKLEEDLPRGCWAVRQDPLAGLVTLRSLAWPGFAAFHAPGSARYGSLYFGFGNKNRDLPFIL